MERLTNDREFRTRYCQDPDGTLQAYLTPDEIRAIKTGDGHSLGQTGSRQWDQWLASLCTDSPFD